MRKNKILYFDYWTLGIKNFKLFDQLLKDKGCETKLLHLNSWRGITGPDYAEVDGIACYDISYYRTNLLYKILAIERPTAVVMLNASFMTDRTIIVACKNLGIKSIYFMHGDIMREEFKAATVESINNRITQSSSRKKILSHLTSTVLNYLYSTRQLGLSYLLRLHPYKVILNTYMNPGAYMFFPPPSFDIKPDMALVYGELDRKFLAQKFNDANYVKIVGNPDLDHYFKTESQLGHDKESFLEAARIPLDKPYVTYIEEGFVEGNFWGNDYRTKFLNEISRVCLEEGYNLVVKLHPHTAKGPHRASLEMIENVVLVDQADLAKLSYFSAICVCHFSTAMIFPMLLGKPLLVPRWGESAKVLTLYSEKEVTFVPTLDDFRQHLRNKSFAYDRAEYLNNHVPFRDGRTSERIVSHIMALVN